MEIRTDDLSAPAVADLLKQHLDDMHQVSPPESVHALDLDKLKTPDIRFWCAWHNEQLLGCGALKIHDQTLGEVKSMRTASAHIRKGVASKMLLHIIHFARTQNILQLKLETGSQPFFEPAHQLYLQHGFEFCGPFANYRNDPNSKFMTLSL